MSKWMQALFMMVVILFALLAIGDFTGIAMFKLIAGIEGVMCGTLALYLSLSQVINEQFEKPVLRSV